MKRLPISYDDFKALRDEDRYYVDKSGLIDEIVNGNAQVYLFTRPRRFGKSLNVSMLDAFFNLEYEGNIWFDGLKVSGCRECMEMRNSYPVISLNLKGLELEDEQKFERSVKNRLKELYDRYGYLKDSERITDLQRRNYRDVLEYDFESTLPSESLKNLSMMLRAHHGTRVIVLIDEYDNPIQNSYGTPMQERIIAFLRNLLTNVLKSNESLNFAVITGIMQIAKENIFSGLNNLYVSNVLSGSFSEYFGFNEDEVKSILEQYGYQDKFDECKEWYDGYRFGESDIYNPWSILKYVDSGCKAETYWAGSSSNEIIGTLLEIADDDVMDDLGKMGSGGSISRDIETEVVYEDIEKNPTLVYSIMVMGGYLNARMEDDGYHLSIPNAEMYTVYQKAILPRAKGDVYSRAIRNLFRAMKGNDTDSIGKEVNNLVKDVLSSVILDSEHVYQAFLIGMMMGFCGNYRIFGDTLETGDGFSDIRFEKQSGSGPHMVIELKRSRDECNLERDAKAALKQIHDKDYTHGLKGRVLLYGISFFKKEPFIISEECLLE